MRFPASSRTDAPASASGSGTRASRAVRGDRPTRAVAMSVIVAALFGGALLGQKADKNKSDTNTRGVQGVVSDDAKAPVSGAVVQLKDTRTLQIRSFITKPDGAYHFTGLSTNVDYELRADKDGKSSGTKRLDVFNTRKVAVIDLRLKK